MKRTLISAVLAAVAASLLTAGAALPGTGGQERYQITPVAEGLAFPWSLAFLPDGRALLTELDGKVRLLGADGTLSAPLGGVPAVYRESQGGLFEAVPHPRFASNGLIYLSYAHGGPDANATRLARARLDGETLSGLEVIFESTPLKDTPVHYGGRMAWLSDGTLLLTLGDGFDYREEAQRLDNHLGTIVRVNDDGSVPPDNPFAGQEGAKPEIWSYGHRNVQGILVDAESGRVWSHEHGAQGGDEINLIEKGRNYGWPVITHGIDYSGALITPYKEYEGMEQPVLVWTPSIAPSGMTLYDGDLFPGWKGDLFVSALAAQNVVRVDLENGEIAGEEVLFAELGERIRDVRTGPAGELYLLTDGPEGSVLRVTPAASATN